jgi:hypothetical protein
LPWRWSVPRAVKEIPTSVTTVDLETGEETHEQSSLKVLPPAPDKCQICAVAHEPELPHDAQSIYYHMTFQGMMGRCPTWADACAHCSPAMTATWKRELTQMGYWTEPPQGETPVKHHGVD